MRAEKVLITGATGSLGEAIALAFARERFSLALTARAPQRLGEVKEQVLGAGACRVAVFPLDAAELDPQSAAQFHQRVINEIGAPDVLVNNAGTTGAVGPTWELGPHDYEEALRTNLFLAIEMCHLFVPAMIKKGFGKIINISGGGATGPREHFAPYALTKTALVRYTETLAAELRGLDPKVAIDANCIAPGAMKTRMTEEILRRDPAQVGEKERAALSRQLQDGGVSPEVAANLCVFLASEAADGISGRLISAVWDDWQALPQRKDALAQSDIYTLRRVIPRDRGLAWGK
jgi:NAD(P)-dependent dehydrogenase (short-subunit alcohol dehydrogenase family)